VDDYLSEREQWEWLKAQLKQNTPWILAGVAIAVLLIGGWRWWQNRTERLALDAGARYEQVLRAFDSGERPRALSVIDELQRDYPHSPYLDQANLAAARVFVESGELDRAALRLRAVSTDSRDPELVLIARERLARVQIAMGKPGEALATLGSVPAGAFASGYREVRGDAYFAKGDKAAALREYLAARSSGGIAVAENDALTLKINDLSGETGAPGSPATQAAAR
jgi:predicted negative regulator of RcsB-dependent stress response